MKDWVGWLPVQLPVDLPLVNKQAAVTILFSLKGEKPWAEI